MKVVVSYDLGGLEAEQGRPLAVSWRWLDSKPTFPLWIALLLHLIVPAKNRNWQAWLILIVPLLASCLRIYYLAPSLGSSVEFDLLIQLLVTFAIAWAALWLVVPYIAEGNRPRAIFSAANALFAFGLLAYLSYFGFWFSFPESAIVIGFWIVGTISLLAPLLLSGLGCRGHFRPGKIGIRLVVWIPVVTFCCMLMVVGSITLAVGGANGGDFAISVVVPALVFSGFAATFLYLVNLPVLILAGLTDCYRERVRTLVCGDNADSAGPAPQDVAVSAEVL